MLFISYKFLLSIELKYYVLYYVKECVVNSLRINFEKCWI